MNNRWYSILELLGLPEFPQTVQKIRVKAKRENWQKRPREKGKGFEYHISSLPAAAIAELSKDFVKESIGELAAAEVINELNANDALTKSASVTASISAMEKINTLPEKERALAFARVSIVEMRETFLRPYEKKLTQGHTLFLTKFKARQLPLDAKTYSAIPKISRATIDRWENALRERGVMALVRHRNPRRSDSVIAQQTELEQFCVALIIERPHFKMQASKVREYAKVQSEKIAANWTIPALSSFSRWIQQWIATNKAKHTFATDHQGFYSSERGLIHEHDMWVAAPNDLWELDSTPTDVMLRVGNKLTRYAIVACIDVFTRRVKMILAPTSTAQAVSLCLRKAILDWGLPNNDGQIKTDNGADYVAKRTVSIIRALGTSHVKATPFSGWEKPYIERFFGTFQGGIVEVMPNYIGHCVQDRELIEARLEFAARIGEGKKKRFEDALNIGMTPEEFQLFMDDWLEHCYHQKPHGGLNGLSPYLKYQNTKYKPVVVSNPRALDMMLNFAGEKSIRRGGVQVNTLIYRAPELQDERYMRQRVNVYLDPCDVAKAFLYPMDGSGECIEAVNADLIGREISPHAFIEARKKTEKSLRSFKRDMKKYAEELGIDDLAAEQIAQAKARNNMVSFPRETQQHNNVILTALESAGVKRSTQRSAAELDAIERNREQRRLQAEKDAQNNARRLRSESEIVWEYAEILANKGELEERQQRWFDEYLRSHTLTAPKIKAFIESGGKTRRMVKK